MDFEKPGQGDVIICARFEKSKQTDTASACSQILWQSKQTNIESVSSLMLSSLGTFGL